MTRYPRIVSSTSWDIGRTQNSSKMNFHDSGQIIRNHTRVSKRTSWLTVEAPKVRCDAHPLYKDNSARCHRYQCIISLTTNIYRVILQLPQILNQVRDGDDSLLQGGIPSIILDYILWRHPIILYIASSPDGSQKIRGSSAKRYRTCQKLLANCRKYAS